MWVFSCAPQRESRLSCLPYRESELAVLVPRGIFFAVQPLALDEHWVRRPYLLAVRTQEVLLVVVLFLHRPRQWRDNP